MRKTSKVIQIRGTSYRVAVVPNEGSIWADVTVDDVRVGMVQQYTDKSGWRFVGPNGPDDLTYGTTMLREVMSTEAWRIHEAKEFAAEVASYDGPMDVTDATTECVDCGQQVLVRTPELVFGDPERTDCPKSTSRHYPGHRVSGSVYRAWQHQQKVIAAVLASREEAAVSAYDRNGREQFLAAYVEAALWSSTDEAGEPLDGLPVVRDSLSEIDALGAETAQQMREDCEAFMDANMADLILAGEGYKGTVRGREWSGPSLAGHDFWLTRNGHGAGFWDRGLGEVGERLTAAAKAFGGVDLYVGDDGLIHGM